MPLDKIKKVLHQYWGYNSFLPLQQEAMTAILSGRDTVVVLPTGGGKSLCFQVPALLLPGVTVVVSPLISLMKDQVDALHENGIAAGRLDSSLSPEEQRGTIYDLLQDQLKLLYISPERLLTGGTLDILKKANVSFVAIDEAHCVSMWGHDFRPEYRQLSQLRKHFPKAVFGAYTATATGQVRSDISNQLTLNDPEMLVGSFDRPNLSYNIRQRTDIVKQVVKIINEHKGQSGVIYCIRRRDVEAMTDDLNRLGFKAAAYHAGMSDKDRKNNQDKFIKEKVDIIVATVAFGMGIDKSNVRYVIHAGMPKSLEHYQQESGRAGRDRLEAQCWLFYGPGDYMLWKRLISDSDNAQAVKIALDKLSHMYNFCTGGNCRHQTILKYFDQELEKDNCQACDVCLGELEEVADSLIIGQKILSCVARLGQSFGGHYTALVLTGSEDLRILEARHNQLSTWGLLKEYNRSVIQNWIEQLCGQGFLVKAGEFNVLHISEKGLELLRGNVKPRLLKPIVKKEKAAKGTAATKGPAYDDWKGVDQELFEKLRQYRTEKAAAKGLPAYVIFGDATLRELARHKPQSDTELQEIKGIGQKKADQYGYEILQIVKRHAR